MKKTNSEFKWLIYDLMNGSLDLEVNTTEKGRYVENEFSEGKMCQMAYAEILDAYQRICKRLGVGEEDKDIEVIMNNFNIIMRHLCMKMYDYGNFSRGRLSGNHKIREIFQLRPLILNLLHIFCLFLYE